MIGSSSFMGLGGCLSGVEVDNLPPDESRGELKPPVYGCIVFALFIGGFLSLDLDRDFLGIVTVGII